MNYKAQLYPWCIIRPFPNMRTQIVGRFRNRSDAEGHLRILKRMIPTVAYQIMFDITPEDSDTEDLSPNPSPRRRGELDSGSPLPLKGRGAGGVRSTEE